MTPLALESAWAVAGGVIPMIGLGGLGWILWRAVKDPPDNPPSGTPPEPPSGHDRAPATPSEDREK